MTIEELKELLSTYGVNEEERTAPVFVVINGAPTPIVAGEVEFGVHPADAAQGTHVLLQAEVRS